MLLRFICDFGRDYWTMFRQCVLFCFLDQSTLHVSLQSEVPVVLFLVFTYGVIPQPKSRRPTRGYNFQFTAISNNYTLALHTVYCRFCGL